MPCGADRHRDVVDGLEAGADDYFGDTRLLDVHIRRLRGKVERDPDSPECVLTLRGSGYKAGYPG